MILQLFSLLLMLWMGWQDLRRQRISNLALLALLACALLYLCGYGQLLGGATAEQKDILLALLLVAALTLPGMTLGQLGAGDVKLLWVLCWVFSLPQLLLVMVAALRNTETQMAQMAEGDIGLIENLGKVLFTQYVVPFEISSVLFLSAMVGAVVIGKKD